MHERDSPRVNRRYIVTLLADKWRADGHEVFHLYGTARFVPADLVIVHVDLSIVPQSYLDFAARYPVAVNGRVRDIRKSTYSRELLLTAESHWNGAVIVKSDLNYGGLPERRRLDAPGDGVLLRAFRPALSRLGVTLPSSAHRGPDAYRIYERLQDVPAATFGDPAVVVQKFVAERDGDDYCVRHFSFLGDRMSFVRLRARSPIVNGTNSAPIERVGPEPELMALRERLGFDYGKFDYVVSEGRPILLDANKTVGCAPNIVDDPELKALRFYRADGLYSYFR